MHLQNHWYRLLNRKKEINGACVLVCVMIIYTFWRKLFCICGRFVWNILAVRYVCVRETVSVMQIVAELDCLAWEPGWMPLSRPNTPDSGNVEPLCVCAHASERFVLHCMLSSVFLQVCWLGWHSSDVCMFVYVCLCVWGSGVSISLRNVNAWSIKAESRTMENGCSGRIKEKAG